MTQTQLDPSGPSTVHQTIHRKLKKTPHRGVLLIPPDAGKPHWRYRYRDPETNTVLTKTLDALDGKTADSRTAFAVKLFKQLRRRKEETQAGASPHRAAATPIGSAINQYFEGPGKLVDDKTRIEYRAGADAFLAWCDAENLDQVRQLTAQRLTGFPEWCAQMKRQSRKNGGKRGEMQLTEQTISRWTATSTSAPPRRCSTRCGARA